MRQPNFFAAGCARGPVDVATATADATAAALKAMRTLQRARRSWRPSGFTGFLGAFRAAFPDMQDSIDDMVTDGDTVGVRGTTRGTHQGEFQGIEATGKAVQVVIAITIIGFLSGMTFGPVAALLVELFPARIRYTSLSVPYHIGTGYFGGFLPFISQYIVARTGDPFSGLWYTIGVVAMALVVTFFWLPETSGKNLD